MRIMSNFSYKDNRGNIIQVPVRYGDMNRQVAQILKKNTENTIPNAPFIACYIKDIQYDPSRTQAPSFTDTTSIRERAVDPMTGELLTTQGKNYTVERHMPTPYLATLTADIWTSNTDQKLQLFEQIAWLFNPSIELQTSDNILDWTGISVLSLKNLRWSSRTIPQGASQDIDILSIDFETQVWISPPALVSKLGVITKIIASTAVNNVGDYINLDADIAAEIESAGMPTVITPGGFDLLIMDNTAQLLTSAVAGDLVESNRLGMNSWLRILDLYPGSFRPGLSQLRLIKPDGLEIVAYISLNPTDDASMSLNFDADTLSSNTLIDNSSRIFGDPAFDTASGRGTIDAIINPETFNPGVARVGVRYLVLEGINQVAEYGEPGYSGPVAWKNSDGTDFQCHENSIISWNGAHWYTVFDSAVASAVIYITNAYTGVQYKWDPQTAQWSKSFEGIYAAAAWRLVL
jgi:hypothetical protein